MDYIDYIGGETLVELVKELQERHVVVAVADPSAELQHELGAFGVTQLIGREHVYATVRDAHDAFQKQKAPS